MRSPGKVSGAGLLDEKRPIVPAEIDYRYGFWGVQINVRRYIQVQLLWSRQSWEKTRRREENKIIRFTLLTS